MGSSSAMRVTPVLMLLLEGHAEKRWHVLLNAGLHTNSSGYGCKPHTAHNMISTV